MRRPSPLSCTAGALRCAPLRMASCSLRGWVGAAALRGECFSLPALAAASVLRGDTAAPSSRRCGGLARGSVPLASSSADSRRVVISHTHSRCMVASHVSAGGGEASACSPTQKYTHDDGSETGTGSARLVCGTARSLTLRAARQPRPTAARCGGASLAPATQGHHDPTVRASCAPGPAAVWAPAVRCAARCAQPASDASHCGRLDSPAQQRRRGGGADVRPP